MKKPMIIMLTLLAILFGGVFLYKLFMGYMMKKYMASHITQISVSATKVGYEDWQPKLSASGSLRAIQGVNVTTELAGMVKEIAFKPGSTVSKGTLLIQLHANTDLAQLASLKANEELARITYERDLAQYKANAVSKQTVDTDLANLKSLHAQVAEQAATVAKKTIRAPFTGRLGISLVNPGQWLNPGDTVVSLQTFDPIYADFYVPQQFLPQLKIGQTVQLKTESYPDKIFLGKITTINPAIDLNTRNVLVEATIANPHYQLAPGMFINLDVITGPPTPFLTLPQTAISFNPYGEIAYIIYQKGHDNAGKPILIANQRFVKTGENRGDQVQILKGLKAGETVVTSGQLKLKNNTQVIINNTIVPSNSPLDVAPEKT